MSVFHDRRPFTVEPLPKTKAEVNGHLVNDHEYLDEGAGSSTRRLPLKAQLVAQHEGLHANEKIHGGHKH